MENLKVDLLSGNNLLKGTAITDENGNFSIEYIGNPINENVIILDSR